MGDVKLAEKFIEQKLGHDAVAEFRAYMKETRRDARKVARDKELANRPDLLSLHVDLKYTYGGDFMFEEGDEYFEHESLLDYLNNSLGLAITNHFEKGYFKLESTCKYINTCRRRNGLVSTYTPDEIVNVILDVIVKGCDRGNKDACPRGAYWITYLGVHEIAKRKLYSHDEIKGYFRNRCYYRITSLATFAPIV